MWWFEVAREREKRNENRKKLKRRRTRGWEYTINRHKHRDRDNRILSHPPRHRHRRRQRRRHKHSKSQKMKNQMLNTLKRNNDCFWFVWKVCLLLYNLFAVCAHYARSPLYKLFYRKTFSFSSEYRVRHGKKPPSYFLTTIFIIFFSVSVVVVGANLRLYNNSLRWKNKHI